MFTEQMTPIERLNAYIEVYRLTDFHVHPFWGI